MTKEIWKDIEGYEGLYQVSDRGRVKSLNYGSTRKERIMKRLVNTKVNRISQCEKEIESSLEIQEVEHLEGLKVIGAMYHLENGIVDFLL